MYMKKILATALAAVGLFSVSVATFAIEDTHKELDRITVKVGYLDDYGIITTPIVQGSEGYGYEYLEKLEEYTNYNFEYVSLSWAEGLEQLKDGEIDLLAPASKNEERNEVYDFIDTIFSHEETNIYALADSTYTYDNPSQLNGKIIGTLEGSIYADRFEAYAKENNLTYTLKYTDPATVFEDMQSGKIDLYVDGSLHLRNGVHSVDKVHTEELYFMTQKGDDSLNHSINTAMLELEDETPYFNDLLWYKYYAHEHEANRIFTTNELTALQIKDVYTVGYHTDLHPISYILDGEPRGYAVDVMNLLADKLDIQLTYMPLHDGSENGPENVDFNLCPMNDDGAMYGTLTEPYVSLKLLAARNENLEKREVQHILVPDFATIRIEDFLELYPSATVHKVYSSADCGRMYGTVDIDCSIFPANSESLTLDGTQKRVNVLDASVPLGITVSNELPMEVHTALNKAISSLTASTVDDLVMETVKSLKKPPTLLDMVMQYRWQILSVFLFILAIIFYILLSNRKNMKRLLEVDTLTGSMTLYKFEKEARRILSTAKPNEYKMIVLDVDKFKTINKVYGTEMGNKVLRILADSMKKQSSQDVIIGRIQSDSFAILSKASQTQQDSAYEEFTNGLKLAGIDMTVYFSIGIYLIEKPTSNISFMLDNARTAKGYGKTIFGNTVHYFTKELQAKHEKETQVLSSMESALADDEFFIVVQPKVDLHSGKLVGGEVLIRWQKKDGTFVYPDEFIPLMEENKFIIHLDRYVLEKTCEFIRDSKVALPILSVNVSATTMLEPDFMKIGHEVLQQYGVKPQQLEVELTESVLDADFNRITNIISQLKKLGVAIAIDDFGKGASSLARIKEVEMDVLKLDRDFIENNAENGKGKLVLKNIISMARDLGITSLAEGIETKEQQDLLVKLGCEQGQGYYFDRPLSISDFTQRVEAQK